MARAQGIKQIAQNRKAFHDYFVLERYEAGIELFGTEVKSIRAGTVNLKDSFCTVKDGELFARGLHISPYEKGNIFNRDPMRPKRLLMHKREINRLNARVMQDGVALIPLSLYFKDGRVKLELGLCKGKKLHDKRDAEAERQAAVLRAEGEAEAIMKVQTALADSIKLLNNANPNDQVVKLKALESFEKAADGQATKIIVPSEIQSLAGLAASFKGLLEDEKK